MKKKTKKCKRKRVINKKGVYNINNMKHNNKCYKQNMKHNIGGTKTDEIREPEYIDEPIVKKSNITQTIIEDHFPKHRQILDLEDNDVLTLIGVQLNNLRNEYNILKEKEKMLRIELCEYCDGGYITGPVIDGYPSYFDTCHHCQSP